MGPRPGRTKTAVDKAGVGKHDRSASWANRAINSFWLKQGHVRRTFGSACIPEGACALALPSEIHIICFVWTCTKIQW